MSKKPKAAAPAVAATAEAQAPRGKPQKRLSRPLETRHVFLDTQVYRNLRHNPVNPALKLLLKRIEEHRIVLHSTDVTLAEIRRQIRETIVAHSRELGKIERDLVQWRKASPANGPTDPISLNIDALAADMFDQFENFIRGDCHATVHPALAIPFGDVFEAYLRRDPPFHGEESKEFPDAVALEALSRWCERQSEYIYVVTEDKAMLKAADVHPRMLTLTSLRDLLADAQVDLDSEAGGEAIADATLQMPAFDGTFEAAMNDEIKGAVFIYAGDLAEGEAYGAELLGVKQVDDMTVVGLSAERVTLILDAVVKVSVEVQYEDREDAIFDREDHVWFGAESASTDVEEEVRLDILIDVERASGTVVEAKILTPEISVYGRTYDDY